MVVSYTIKLSLSNATIAFGKDRPMYHKRIVLKNNIDSNRRYYVGISLEIMDINIIK